MDPHIPSTKLGVYETLKVVVLNWGGKENNTWVFVFIKYLVALVKHALKFNVTSFHKKKRIKKSGEQIENKSNRITK